MVPETGIAAARGNHSSTTASLQARAAPRKPLLVLVRHGHDQTESGTTDPPLSDLGRGQAKALGLGLVARRFEAIYTSPRLRTVETAGILGERLGLDPIMHVGIREVKNGIACLAAVPRIASFLGSLESSGPVLVVTHGGTIGLILALAGGWRAMPELWRQVAHCQPLVCSLQRKRFALTGR